MQKIPFVMSLSHRNCKRYVAMQTISHVVDYLYSLALRSDAINSARSCPEFLALQSRCSKFRIVVAQ